MLERTFHYKDIASPVGTLRLIASQKGLCAVTFGSNAKQSYANLERKDDHFLLSKTEKPAVATSLDAPLQNERC